MGDEKPCNVCGAYGPGHDDGCLMPEIARLRSALETAERGQRDALHDLGIELGARREAEAAVGRLTRDLEAARALLDPWRSAAEDYAAAQAALAAARAEAGALARAISEHADSIETARTLARGFLARALAAGGKHGG